MSTTRTAVLRGAMVAALGFLDGRAKATEPAAPVEQLTPVLASVLVAPRIAPLSDGRTHLAHELELTNATDVPMTVESIEVVDPTRGAARVRLLDAEYLKGHLSLPGQKGTNTLGPGQAALVYANLDFASPAEVPGRLAHRITATTTQPKGPLPARSVEDVAATEVGRRPPMVIGAPLRGERWVAAASCCDSYHRRAALPVNGQRYLAQRFAIDWIQLEPDGRLVHGDPKVNESYPQFGADVLAVADATVASVRDGLPEGTPGSFPPLASLDVADGNSIVLDLGGGRYALYAHLQPRSLRVARGDRVRRGQVLARLGNTGNSDAPHLHFHVMDGPTPLGSNGVPYAIDAFEVTGQAVSASDLDDELKSGAIVPVEPAPVPARRTKELPADLAVVRFAE
jgi:hypothetical protein